MAADLQSQVAARLSMHPPELAPTLIPLADAAVLEAVLSEEQE